MRIEPATGAPIARIAASGQAEVDAAVAGARRRFGEDWRWRSPRERGALMRKVAARIREHVDELAELEAREVGKPRRDALRFDVSSPTRFTARSSTRARSRRASSTSLTG